MEVLKRAVEYMQRMDGDGTFDELPKEVESGNISLENAKMYCAGVLRRWRDDSDSPTILILIRDLLGLKSPVPTETQNFMVGDHKFDMKYLVLKWEDVGGLLSITEQYQLLAMIKKINKYRQLAGKKDNTYLVINTDEAYANDIAEILVFHKSAQGAQY